MKFRNNPDRVSRPKAVDVLQKPLEEREPSEFFDPFQDLPAAKVERMKWYVSLSPDIFFTVFAVRDSLEETTWLRWVDPAYAEALDTRLDLSDQLIQEFRNSVPTRPQGVVFLNVEMDFGVRWLKLFPKQREQIIEGVFTEEKYQSFMNETSSFHSVDYAQQVAMAIQIWPQHRAALVRALETGLASQGGLFAAFKSYSENSRADFHSLIRVAANICLINPSVREEVIQLVKEARADIQNELGSNKQADSIQVLTILGAERAIINQEGNIEVELKPPPARLASQLLPPRLHT